MISQAIGKFTSSISDIVGKFVPDKTKALEMQSQITLAMLKLEEEAVKGQLEINKVEAAHRSIYVAGWRPFVGWVCASGMAVEFVIKPLLAPMGIDIPSISIFELTGMLGGILGLGAYRTNEKIKGVSR